MASLLAPSASQPSRISQVLPTVKCSNCNRPVPLSELGDHICAPQTVSPPSRPPRLASLAAGIPHQRTGTPPVHSPRSPPRERLPSPFDRPPANAASGGPSFQQRLSPLAGNDTATSLQHPQKFQPPATASYRPPVMDHSQTTDNRTRAASNASVRQPIPAIQTHLVAPPPFASSLGPLPSVPMRDPAISISPAGGDIDTKIGGAAGMAGVGRRGFAAAARAAMVVAPSGHVMDRRPNPPRFLDMDVPTRSPDTPPLSAGSGYSSHSPDPLSPRPQTDLVPEALSRLQHPAFPPQQSPSPNFANIRNSPAEEFANGFGLSPLDRLPLLGKYMNQPSLSTSPESLFSFEQRKSPPHGVPQDVRGDMMSSTYPNDRTLSRKDTKNTIKSTTSNEMAEQSLPPPTSDSDSECGLAYADSTDDENETAHASSNRVSNTIIGPDSAATKSNHVHFSLPEANKSSPSRQSAASSYSSASGSEKNDIMAKALRSPPTSPGRLGKTGGVTFFGSGLRRSDSGSSDDSRSTYSRVTSMAPMMGPLSKGSMEHTMETLMEEAGSDVSTADMAKESKSFGNQNFKEKDDRYVENKSHERDIGLATMSGQPHRSNTVQVPPHSPENKPPKLPTRAKTTNDSTKLPPRNEKARRVRICLRCQEKIDDGRWIRVDTGGALCETCWKNMYLPKCRRCTLPIEKQAVSSADGQLKGKYHKECFNCHVCHKTFPDKSFYVFDGKPLCAYHYHEANRSLCAAARCGQPIEGPCALSHTGDKYHPEHMTCEHPGLVPCKERLKEYWEINGKMLCEWHAAEASRDQDEEEEWVQTSKAKKRITRFMNLSSMGGSGGEDSEDLSGLL